MLNTAARYLWGAAKRYPNKIAFQDHQKSVTFAELDTYARSLARAIQKNLGKAVRQPIGVYLPKGVDCIAAFMGAAYSGNYYSPLDTAMPQERLKKSPIL